MCECKACSDEQCEVPYGLCHCGCGEPAPIANEHRPKRGIYRGEPYRFARQHHMRGLTGERHPSWKGGRTLTKSGYWLVAVAPDHPMADANNNVYEHRLVMAEVMGRPLRSDEHVHHKNHDKTDNRPENLLLTDNASHLRAHNAVLDEDKVRYVRRKLSDGVPIRQLADELGVSKGTIDNVRARRWWNHVT